MTTYQKSKAKFLLILTLIYGLAITYSYSQSSEGDCCDGKISQLTLKYQGQEQDAEIKVVQKKDGQVAFLGTVQPDEEFSFSGLDKKGTFSTEIWIYVNGEENTRIHTSCSVPVGPGLISGDFEVISGESRNGGALCAVDGGDDDGGDHDDGDDDGDDDDGSNEDDCCDGKISQLTLKYLGQEQDAEVKVVQKKDRQVAFLGTVQPDEEFSFSGLDKKGTFSTEIWIYVNGAENTRIHTSCSVPVGPGLISGDFEVISGESRNGGALCAIDGDDDGGGDHDGDDDDGSNEDDCCDGKISQLTLKYLGQEQDAEVKVVQKKDGQVAFLGTVQPDEEFSFSGLDKKGTFSTEIWIYVNGEENTRIHTSCSVPVGPGLISGDFEVISGESRNGGALCAVDGGDDDGGNDDGGGDDGDGGGDDGGGELCDCNCDADGLFEAQLDASDLLCFDDLGSISLIVNGGAEPYSFFWSNNANTQNLEGLSAGTYDVIIRDATGVELQLIGVIENPPLLEVLTSVSQITCAGANDGSIALAISGGVEPYTITWDNGGSTTDITGLSAGTYQATISDSNQCTHIEAFEITEPLALVTSITTSECNDGTLSLEVSGGKAPYSYLWSTGAVSKDIKVSATGTYSVVATDDNGCMTTENFELTSIDIFEVSTSVKSPTCFNGNDGSATVSVSGASNTFTYSWSTGATTATVDGLNPGTYSVIVTGENGCASTEVVIVPNVTPIFIQAKTTSISCNGANDGSINVAIFFGKEPYSYSWSNGETTEDLSNLTPGVYGLTVTDANQCSRTSNITIREPEALTTALAVDYCGDGFLQLSISGGTAPYFYEWSTGETTKEVIAISGGTFWVKVTDFNGCTDSTGVEINDPHPAMNIAYSATKLTCFNDSNASIDLTVTEGVAPYTYDWSTGETTEDISGLLAGVYTVIVSDASTCKHKVTVSIVNPSPVLFQAMAINMPSCASESDGSIAIKTTSGVAPFTFSWSNGATTQDIDNLTAGDYTLTMTDANKCTVSGTFTITEPPAIVVESSVVLAGCGLSDGSISLIVSGGTAPYSYLWSTGETSKDINALITGVYSVDITDASGCTNMASVEVTDDCDDGGDGGSGDGGDGGSDDTGGSGLGTDDCDCTCTSPSNSINDDSEIIGLLKEELLVYPNPLNSGDDLTIQSGGTARDTETIIRIYDLTGEMLVNEKYNFAESKISVGTGKLTKGVYIIEIKQGDKVSTRRFIIE